MNVVVNFLILFLQHSDKKKNINFLLIIALICIISELFD